MTRSEEASIWRVVERFTIDRAERARTTAPIAWVELTLLAKEFAAIAKSLETAAAHEPQAKEAHR